MARPQSRRRAQPGWTPGEHGNDECGLARPSPCGPGLQRAPGCVACFAKAASLGCSMRLAVHPAAALAHHRFQGFSGLGCTALAPSLSGCGTLGPLSSPTLCPWLPPSFSACFACTCCALAPCSGPPPPGPWIQVRRYGRSSEVGAVPWGVMVAQLRALPPHAGRRPGQVTHKPPANHPQVTHAANPSPFCHGHSINLPPGATLPHAARLGPSPLNP